MSINPTFRINGFPDLDFRFNNRSLRSPFDCVLLIFALFFLDLFFFLLVLFLFFLLFDCLGLLDFSSFDFDLFFVFFLSFGLAIVSTAFADFFLGVVLLTAFEFCFFLDFFF